MKKKNQMADLRRLISLPHRQMKKLAHQYIYEPPGDVLKYLFRLMYSEKLTSTKKKNLLTLARYVLDELAPETIPSWLAVELDRFLRNEHFSLVEKAMLLSGFAHEELLSAVPGYEDFMNALVEEHSEESFEDFLIENISRDPGVLAEIYFSFTEKTNPEALKFMLSEIEEKSYPQVLKVLEVLTYHPDSEIAIAALFELAEAKTQDALKRLYSISKLNLQLRDEAERLSVDLMYELPMPETGELRTKSDNSKYQDLWVSLIDGKGSLSAMIGKKTARGRYFLANLLLNSEAGVKDVQILPGLSHDDYMETKGFVFEDEDVSFFPVSVDYMKKLIKHFLYINIKKNMPVHPEVIVLKNVLDWDDIEPEIYNPEIPEFEPVSYSTKDLRQFPFNTWWLHEKVLYDMLRPFRNMEIIDIPPEVYDEVYKLMLDYAVENLADRCALCADIIRNSNYRNRTRQIRLFLTLRQEILLASDNRDYIPEFLGMSTVRSISNVLHNLAMGINSPEEAEEY